MVVTRAQAQAVARLTAAAATAAVANQIFRNQTRDATALSAWPRLGVALAAAAAGHALARRFDTSR